MARKIKEEVKAGLPAWMGTYGDLVTLLMCFFVLLFASSSVDIDKYSAIAQSFNSNITFIQAGGSSGVNNMLGSGINNLPILDKSVLDSDQKAQKERDELNKMAAEFKTYFAKNDAADNINVEVGPNYVKITFGDGVLFDSGQAVLKDSSLNVLSMIGGELQKHPDSHVKIEGHTDNVPIKSPIYPDNMYLSAARSIFSA